jgi:ribosomal protein S18 acetylase RimI-like enzyme
LSHTRLDHLLQAPVEGWFPRMAEESDFEQMAELFDIANANTMAALWNRDAPEGQTWVDMLKPMMFGEFGELNYKNIAVADVGGKAVGMLVVNVNSDPWPIEDFSLIKPYAVAFSKLRGMLPGYGYLRIMAVFPEFRGLRIATNLLDIAFNLAIKSGWKGVCATVHDGNALLLEHYRKRGLKELGRSEVVEHISYDPKSNWILLSVDAPGGFLSKNSYPSPLVGEGG